MVTQRAFEDWVAVGHADFDGLDPPLRGTRLCTVAEEYVVESFRSRVR